MIDLREYHLARRCEFRGRSHLLPCRGAMAGQCQYCGRGFCARHGERFNEHEEVCRGAACQAKMTDLPTHLAFREEAAARNAEARCGEPGCAGAPEHHCKRCGAEYCPQHLRRRGVSEHRRGELTGGLIIICTHCLARISIWTRG